MSNDGRRQHRLDLEHLLSLPAEQQEKVVALAEAFVEANARAGTLEKMLCTVLGLRACVLVVVTDTGQLHMTGVLDGELPSDDTIRLQGLMDRIREACETSAGSKGTERFTPGRALDAVDDIVKRKETPR